MTPSMTNNKSHKYCNHHHDLTEDHELVEIGGCEFVANKRAIPLLQALNDVGLSTRSHHIRSSDENAFICILMENIHHVEIKEVFEKDADRTRYNGKQELVIQWTPSAPSV